MDLYRVFLIASVWLRKNSFKKDTLHLRMNNKQYIPLLFFGLCWFFFARVFLVGCIKGKGARVSAFILDFSGLSLSSRLNSVFLKEPLIHDASALKEWYPLNKKDVDRLVTNMAYKDTSKSLPKPSAADIMHIQAAMGTLESIKTAWIAGRLKLIPGQEKFWYMACKNCQKDFKHGHHNDKPCTSCGEVNPITVWCHIGVMIADKTGTTYAEIYSPDVELLIPFTAEKFKNAE